LLLLKIDEGAAGEDSRQVMATEPTHPHYALTITTLQQIEQWIDIAKDLDVSDFSKAFPAIFSKIGWLNAHDICGSEEHQLSVLGRLTTARQNLKILGCSLDENITKGIENLAKGALVRGMRLVGPVLCESLPMLSCHSQR